MICRSRMSFDQTSYLLDDMINFEKQLQELFDEVKRMIMMGNRNDAMDLLKANYEAVIERMNKGSKGIEEAALLDVITLGYMAVGDLKFVGSLLSLVICFFHRRCDNTLISFILRLCDFPVIKSVFVMVKEINGRIVFLFMFKAIYKL